MEEKVGLICGRFQPIHRGHVELIKTALKECDTLVIAVGSAQEYGTKKNPFDFETRKELILRSLWGVYNKNVVIIGVNDRKNIVDDSSWGKYLISQVIDQTGLVPTVNFTGKEEVRSHWFDEVPIIQQEVDRDILPISATEVRQAILDDDYVKFVELTPPGLWLQYNKIQDKLKEIYND